MRREGRWLVDEHGRVVIVHGFNLVWKLDPYVPPATAEGFTAADADWLERYGFNGARLGTLWAGITPDAPGAGDPSYRQGWQRVMDLLADRGIWMQLDMHQDQWHETYGGEGVPDWALHRPALLSLLPPVNLPFPIGYRTPDNSLVFDEFWANRHRGIDHWAAAWQVAAGWWKDQPYLMGYDLVNEPWMGLEWLACFTTGCRSSYVNELQPAYEKVTRAIRAVDGENVVWWEPQQLAAGRQVPTYLEPMAGEDQLGYSWHNYCQDVFLESQGLPLGNVENCWKFSQERTTTALAQADRIHAAALMSEWGATDNIRAVEIDAAVADRNLMGWTHWAYKQWQDPTTADDAQGMFHDDTDFASVKADKLPRAGPHLRPGDRRDAARHGLRRDDRCLHLPLPVQRDRRPDRDLRQPAPLPPRVRRPGDRRLLGPGFRRPHRGPPGRTGPGGRGAGHRTSDTGTKPAGQAFHQHQVP